MTQSNFQSNTWKLSFDIFEHKQDLRCTPIQFQIPILRLSIISISRNEITHRIWPNPISNPIHGHPKMPLWMASLWAECWNWWILSNLELCGGFNQDRDKIAHTVYNQCRKKKNMGVSSFSAIFSNPKISCTLLLKYFLDCQFFLGCESLRSGKDSGTTRLVNNATDLICHMGPSIQESTFVAPSFNKII